MTAAACAPSCLTARLRHRNSQARSLGRMMYSSPFRPTQTAIRCSRHAAKPSGKRANCARSFICRRSAFTAIKAAAGSTSKRRRERLAAERAWQDFGSQRGIAVTILRLAGIYGPGRNALVQIASGKARRVVKRGQIFNRIHVADIAQAIDAGFVRTASGNFNLGDDEPTPASDPLLFAAQLMGREPPPEIPFAEAAPSMSPMALSFWQDCRRVHNDKLKRELGIKLRYPTYRDGLRALFEEK